MAAIVVESLGAREFRVAVGDCGSETTHCVVIPGVFEADCGLPQVALETVVERSFEFLLERERSSSIRHRFTLSEISRYFPEYQGEIAHRLSQTQLS
jgi:hypothetical protein